MLFFRGLLWGRMVRKRKVNGQIFSGSAVPFLTDPIFNTGEYSFDWHIHQIVAKFYLSKIGMGHTKHRFILFLRISRKGPLTALFLRPIECCRYYSDPSD